MPPEIFAAAHRPQAVRSNIFPATTMRWLLQLRCGSEVMYSDAVGAFEEAVDFRSRSPSVCTTHIFRRRAAPRVPEDAYIVFRAASPSRDAAAARRGRCWKRLSA